MSQYLILIYDNEDAWMNATPDVSARLMEGHTKFGENNGDKIQGGNALQSVTTATTLRPDGSGGFTTTDGPFVETKEAFGGFYLIDVPNLDDALEFAATVPAARNGGAVEVRPLVEL